MDDVADAAYVLTPGEGRSIDLGAFRMSVLATGEQTNGAFSLLEADEPAGFGPPLHVHRDAAEAFYVLDGEYVIFLGDREYVCPAGSFIRDDSSTKGAATARVGVANGARQMPPDRARRLCSLRPSLPNDPGRRSGTLVNAPLARTRGASG